MPRLQRQRMGDMLMQSTVTEYKGEYTLKIEGNKYFNLPMDYKPSWFKRKMMRWCFGIEWEDYKNGN